MILVQNSVLRKNCGKTTTLEGIKGSKVGNITLVLFNRKRRLVKNNLERREKWKVKVLAITHPNKESSSDRFKQKTMRRKCHQKRIQRRVEGKSFGNPPSFWNYSQILIRNFAIRRENLNTRYLVNFLIQPNFWKSQKQFTVTSDNRQPPKNKQIKN